MHSAFLAATVLPAARSLSYRHRENSRFIADNQSGRGLTGTSKHCLWKCSRRWPGCDSGQPSAAAVGRVMIYCGLLTGDYRQVFRQRDTWQNTRFTADCWHFIPTFQSNLLPSPSHTKQSQTGLWSTRSRAPFPAVAKKICLPISRPVHIHGPESEANHSSPTSAEVKNEWRLILHPQYALMAGTRTMSL